MSVRPEHESSSAGVSAPGSPDFSRMGKSPKLPISTYVFTLIVMLSAGVSGTAVSVRQGPTVGDSAWAALPVLGILMVTAAVLVVHYRGHNRYGDGINIVEAALAPMMFAFPAWAVLITVVIAHSIHGITRRIKPVQTVFNVSQFALASITGILVFDHMTVAGEGFGGNTLLALMIALGVVAVVNNFLLTVVLALAGRKSMHTVLEELAPILLPGWVVGFFVNTLVGLLFTAAYATTPWTVALFPGPLVALHLAYRGFVTARNDQFRLGGMHRAAQALGAPIEPREGIREYLRELAVCFEAAGSELVLRAPEGREVHHYILATDQFSVRIEPVESATLEGALAGLSEPVCISATGRGPLDAQLRHTPWRDCLAAPLMDAGTIVGTVLVFEQSSVTGSGHEGELAVLSALARESASIFAKGKLLTNVLEERRLFTEIVSTTSDGIFTLDTEGHVRTWNPAFERITGISAEEALNDPRTVRKLQLRRMDDTPVDLSQWSHEHGGSLQGIEDARDVRCRTKDGSIRRLTCSYSFALGSDGTPHSLVVVARDLTPMQEASALREQYEQLAQVEAAQRVVVDHLQQAVMPIKPEVVGADLGMAYVPSDPAEPTGGDLYDWHQLESGELHLAVIDVLGHGVAATKDALAVMHTLRLLAVQNVALEEIVGAADALLGVQNPELVATVVIARFNPTTGALRLVTGGHPPALVVTSRGEVTQLAPGGGAIGWPGAGSDGVAELVLEAGDALLMYTDGLVESRKDILEGLEILEHHARDLAGTPAQLLADTLIERNLIGAERSDDTLAMVLRRTPARVRSERGSWTYTPGVDEATEGRKQLSAWLAERSIFNMEIEVVAAELLSNAARCARGNIRLSVALEDGVLSMEVSDDGQGSDAIHEIGHELVEVESENGRGLFLVRQLSDSVDILSTAEGTVISTRHRVGEGVPGVVLPAARES